MSVLDGDSPNSTDQEEYEPTDADLEAIEAESIELDDDPFSDPDLELYPNNVDIALLERYEC